MLTVVLAKGTLKAIAALVVATLTVLATTAGPFKLPENVVVDKVLVLGLNLRAEFTYILLPSLEINTTLAEKLELLLTASTPPKVLQDVSLYPSYCFRSVLYLICPGLAVVP